MRIVSNYFVKKTISSIYYTFDVTLDEFNKRLKVEDYRGDIREIINEAVQLTVEKGYEKIIIYARAEDLETLLSEGFMLEAIFKKYFNGSDAYAFTRYYDPIRRTSEKWVKEDEIIDSIKLVTIEKAQPTIPDGFKLRKAVTHDAQSLAALYSRIFKVYPTPLNDPAYLTKVMEEATVFYVIESNGKIVSAASADINEKLMNAELTDCATLPDFRKHGFMKILLTRLEQELVVRGVYCSYSIARSLSYGMNACFYQLGYKYTGRMLNNCYIYDKLEDMNVWVKDLSIKS